MRPPESQEELERRRYRAVTLSARSMALVKRCLCSAWIDTGSAAAFLVASILLALIEASQYKRRDAFTAPWLVLAEMFLYLSPDEASRRHETSTQLFEGGLGFS